MHKGQYDWNRHLTAYSVRLKLHCWRNVLFLVCNNSDCSNCRYFQLSMFSFYGDTVNTFGDDTSCYHNRSVNPVGFARLQLYEFISSLWARGKTQYKTGICKAIEMLNNQLGNTRHNSEFIVTKSLLQYVSSSIHHMLHCLARSFTSSQIDAVHLY